MSDYKHFLKDYPTRAMTIYKEGKRQALENDCEITLLLTITATCLVAPTERLKKKHPSGDNKRYTEAYRKMEELKKKSFLLRNFGST